MRSTICSWCFHMIICFVCVLSISSCRPRAANIRAGTGDTVAKINTNPYVSIDQSPMDMSYFPVDYPVLKMNKQDTSAPVARVIYSRPHKKNRVIFSNAPNSLCEYGREWRLGANEATELELFRNVTIADKNVAKGTYILYCIPYPDKWVIVLNKNLNTWGLHMDVTKDILRTEIPVKPQLPALEDFTIVFRNAEYGADLLMAWDNVTTSLPIAFSK